MAFEIDEKKVEQVMLPNGAWHRIVPGSFSTDAYQYQQDGLVATTDATWRENVDGIVRVVFCPMTSVQALAYGWTSGRMRE